MNPVFPVLGASVTTFAATNLDDLFLLTVLGVVSRRDGSLPVNTWVLG
jgi:hypothetical protein